MENQIEIKTNALVIITNRFEAWFRFCIGFYMKMNTFWGASMRSKSEGKPCVIGGGGVAFATGASFRLLVGLGLGFIVYGRRMCPSASRSPGRLWTGACEPLAVTQILVFTRHRMFMKPISSRNGAKWVG